MAKVLLLLALALASCPSSPRCPLHEHNRGVYTHTDYIDGKRVDTFQCPRGPHKFQLVCN